MIRRLFATVAIVSAVALAGCSSGGGAQPTTTPVILEIGGVAGVAGDALTYLRTAPPQGVEVQWLQYSDAPGMVAALANGSNEAILINANLMTSIPGLETLIVFNVAEGGSSHSEVLAFESTSPHVEQLRKVAQELSSEQTRIALAEAGYDVTPPQ